jgi:DNA-binding transcriptional ArsR family regulator
LFVIHEVNDKKLSVQELAQKVCVDISTMSKHLDVLKKNRIIKGEKEKNYVYYRLTMPYVLEFMSCARNVKTKT